MLLNLWQRNEKHRLYNERSSLSLSFFFLPDYLRKLEIKTCVPIYSLYVIKIESLNWSVCRTCVHMLLRVLHLYEIKGPKYMEDGLKMV